MMSGALNRKKWWIAGGAAVLFGLALVVPEVTHAGIWPDWLSPVGIVTAPFRVLGYIINYIIGIFLWLATQVTNTMFEMNEEILSESNAIVGVGWNLTRDVANLGFVLLLILIALATIVRYREYEASRLLPKLIAAAILVNFSLAIAGIFIDFSNVLTRTFVNRTQGGGTFALINDIMSAFSPQRLMLSNSENPLPPDPAEEQGALLTFGAGVLSSLAGIVFSIIFTAIATLAMAALAIMLFLRYLHLTFLVLIAPLTWLFWVFPGLSRYHGEWWSAFIKWVFFAPAVSFFMYLATLSVRALQYFRLDVTQGQGVVGALTNVLSQGVQMFVLAGIMLGGIIVGQKFGIGGAAAVMKVAEGAKAGALKWGKSVSQRAAIATARGAKSAASGIAESKYGKRVLQSEQFKGVASGTKATKERLQKVGKGFEVKPEDKFFTKLTKRVSNVATGATGLRALSGFTGGAMELPKEAEKYITTTAGRSVKKESPIGSILLGAKEGLLGKPEKEEKTEEDLKKDLQRTTESYDKLKKDGIIKDGDDNDKKWLADIERAKRAHTNIIGKPPDTEAELERYINKMMDNMNQATGEANREVLDVYRQRMEEAQNKKTRLLTDKARRSGVRGSLDHMIEELTNAQSRTIQSITKKLDEGDKKTREDLIERLRGRVMDYNRLRDEVTKIDAKFPKKNQKEERELALKNLLGGDEKFVSEKFEKDAAGFSDELRAITYKDRKWDYESKTVKENEVSVGDELQRNIKGITVNFKQGAQYVTDSETDDEGQGGGEKKKEGPKVRGYQGEGDFKDAEKNRKDR